MQDFSDMDTLEDLKHDDIASGLPFIPISLVSIPPCFLVVYMLSSFPPDQAADQRGLYRFNQSSNVLAPCCKNRLHDHIVDIITILSLVPQTTHCVAT